ncbi:hypothetical protein QYF61_026940 [Mycteria americana]|uniref:Uncharacterized protein n=1 Tax=Mycteria americana TaxID=33587 RepID=A0AAN7PMT2_MYCAM|nr:hypothetical protein QYF61_026940 [Mycteria americana]
MERVLFTKASSDGIRNNGFKLKEGRFKLDVRKIFFMVRVYRDTQWILFPVPPEGQVQNEIPRDVNV